MLNTHASVSEFPTGRWLRAQRVARGLTMSQLAQQLDLHASTLRALEQQSRVIPPGWYAPLEHAGFLVPQITWPHTMRPYPGSQLALDMEQVSGLRHSNDWLARQLAIPDTEVRTTMRLDLDVPGVWLLKLAELGARVPAEVHVALVQSRLEPEAEAAREQRSEVQAPGADRVEGSHPLSTGSPTPLSEPQDAQHFSLAWSEQDGLRLSVSPALLRDMQRHLRAAIHELVRSPWLAEAAARSQ